MTMPLSDRARNLKPSATFRLAQRAQELKSAGKDVLSFGLGEPDFPTPERVRAAARAAIEAGATHYTANEGILPLRKAICDVFKADQGVVYDPGKEVIVTAGAKQAIANALFAMVQEGDEVLIPGPYWLSYPEMVSLCGAEARFVPTHARDGFRLSAEELEKACSPRSRVLILNSPNNPTGAVLDAERLDAIAEVVLRRDLYVVSDEIYGPLVYGGVRHRSITAVRDGLRERTVVCDGVSKSFAMTGWRLGWALGPREVIGAMSSIQSHTTSNASSISQHASLEALKHCREEVEPMRAEFERRREMVLARMRSMRGLELDPPEGAFYVFPRVAAFYGRTSRGGVRITDSASFCEALLNDALVSVVPGGVFGDDDCFRLSYAASVKEIQAGLERIAAFLDGLS
ncbi:MAG: pyridoxal phosphate-dependent aminotransferase [Planctomycetes bacterium]|nr:pyridoxal phosphate-dependent aminotransferase [Planctomycetota bacterium]